MANERTGNYPEAVKAYERGLEAEPDNVELLNSLGFALFQQGRSEEAVASLEKALELDPEHWKAHNNMALAAIDLGELELAEAHYRESIAIEPQPAIYNDLGFVLERMGMGFEAVDMYRSALELDPESATAHYNLAMNLAREGEFAEAEPHFRAAAEIEPSTQAWTGLGLVLWQLNRGDEAVTSLEKAIETDPGNAAAYDQLGTIQIQRGQLAEAARTYRALVAQRPSAAAHRELAQVLSRQGKNAEARDQMAMAAALDGAGDAGN